MGSLKGKCWCCGAGLLPNQEFCEECAVELVLIKAQMPEVQLELAAAVAS